MKTAKSLFILICFPAIVLSQNITVGQQQGPGIIYRDIEDINLHGTEWEYDEAYLDVNEDGIDDLRFLGYAVYYSHLNYYFSDASVKGISGTNICICPELDNWVDNLALSTAINDQMDWGAAATSFLLNHHSSEGVAGLFNGDGYLAFRIYEPDMIYGWMKVFINCNGFDAYITIYEYAYYDTGLAGIREIDRIENLAVGPNPFAHSTTLSYTLGQPEDVQFTVYNVQAQVVFHMQEKQEKGRHELQWNAMGVPAGTYYYRIAAGARIGSGKMVKVE